MLAALALTAALQAPLPAAAGQPGQVRGARTIGPFVIESADGAWSLRPGFAGQLRYEMLTRAVDDDQLRDTSSEVQARRIRTVFRGTLFSADLSYYFHLSTAPGSLEFMDLYLDYRFLDGVQARVGQWKIPFTRFRINSFKDLTLVEWPMVTRYFGAERQLGLCLHNGYEHTRARFEYEAGVFTGVNARASHAIGLARMFGEPTPNPSDLVDPAPPAAVHPELVARFAFNHGSFRDLGTDTDFTRGPLRLSAGVNVAWDAAPERRRDLSLRLAPELLLKLWGVSFNGILYVAFAQNGDGIEDQRLAFVGGLVQASYLVLDWLEASLRYAVVHSDAVMRDAARDHARDLLAAASSPQEAEQLQGRLGEAGRLRQEQEATVGVNLYLVGKALKLQNDFSLVMRNLGSSGVRRDLRLRTQLQLAF